jgi:hypothetical protein
LSGGEEEKGGDEVLISWRLVEGLRDQGEGRKLGRADMG